MKFNPQFNNMVLPVTFGMYSTRQLAIRDFTRMSHLLIGGDDRIWEVHVLAFFYLFARGEAFAGKSAICLNGP